MCAVSCGMYTVYGTTIEVKDELITYVLNETIVHYSVQQS
jgi:hypothetical protein